MAFEVILSIDYGGLIRAVSHIYWQCQLYDFVIDVSNHSIFLIDVRDSLLNVSQSCQLL